MSTDEHNWFSDHAAAYVVGGLSADERARVESHAAACGDCAGHLSALQQTDQTMNNLFACMRPTAGFEQAIIDRLDRPMRLVNRKVNPFVRRAAVAAAAAIVLGGFGYVASEKINNDRWPMVAFDSSRVRVGSNFRQIGQAVLLYGIGNRGAYLLNQANAGPTATSPTPDWARGARAAGTSSATTADESFTAPSSNAQKWDYAGGTNTAQNWVNWNGNSTGLLKNENYSYEDPSSKAEAGNKLAFGDGHVQFDQNPFSGVQRDNIYRAFGGGNAEKPRVAGSAIPLNGPGDGNDSILLPTDGEETGKAKAETPAQAPAADYFRPSDGGRESSDRRGSSGIQLGDTMLGERKKMAESEQSVPAVNKALALNGINTYAGDTGVSGGSTVDLGSTKDAQGASSQFYFKPGSQTKLGFGLDFNGTANSLNDQNKRQENDALAMKTEPAAASAGEAGKAAADLPSTPPQAESKAPEQPAATPSMQRKVIRNGTMEFIVDSFDSAYMQVSAIVAEEGGYVGTTNSDKMPNGKVTGTITIRIAPDRLDVLVLKLRALGELKGQKITAEDVTKEYTDLGSELRAARAMEDRLLELIKDGKGSIKDLLAAEKELGDWREKIEKITGQMNYYDNLVALSTLELTITEKDIKTPALASQSETVDMGVETEDVEKARTDAISAVDEVKGRIVESELKQLDAGQLAAKIIADVPADKAGPVIDHLKQLGKVSRLEVQRQEVTTDGHGNSVNADTLPPGLRIEQKDTRLSISLYNLANVAPRQTVNAELACDDVEASYHSILDRVNKAGGRVLSSNLSRPTPDQVTGTLSFEVKSTDADGVLMDVKQTGEVMNSNVTENPDTNNVTSTKRGFSVQLRSIASVNPREVRTLAIATRDVTAGYTKLVTTIQGLKARVIVSKLDNERDANGNQQNQTAGWLDFEVKRGDIDAVEHALSEAGDSIERQVVRSNDDQNTLDTKVQFKVGLHDATLLPPRESWTLAVECGDVDLTQADVLSAASAAGGRVVDSTLSKEAGGRTTAHLIIDVPLGQSAVVVDRVKHEGDPRVVQSTQNPQAPDGQLARSRLDISIATPEAIVSGDRGLWGSIRAGLTTSVAGLLWSLQLIVIGLCLVGPFLGVIWVGWKVIKW